MSTEVMHPWNKFKCVESVNSDTASMKSRRPFIHDCDLLTKILAQDITSLQSKERQDAEYLRAISVKWQQLDDETKAITNLKALRNEVKNHWSNIKLHHNINVQHTAATSVDVEGDIGWCL